MEYTKFEGLLIAELDRTFASRPRGTVSAVLSQMGLAPNYFRQWKQGTKVNMVRLLECLDILGVEPFLFFARALRPHDWLEVFVEDVMHPEDQPIHASTSSEVQEAIGILKRRGLDIDA